MNTYSCCFMAKIADIGFRSAESVENNFTVLRCLDTAQTLCRSGKFQRSFARINRRGNCKKLISISIRTGSSGHEKNREFQRNFLDVCFIGFYQKISPHTLATLQLKGVGAGHKAGNNVLGCGRCQSVTWMYQSRSSPL